MHEGVLDSHTTRAGVAIGLAPALLIGLTTAGATLFGMGAQSLGATILWGGAFAIVLYSGFRGRVDDVAIVLVVIFSTASIFQAGIELGYRGWFYLAALTGLYLAVFRPATTLDSGWGWLLLASGVAIFHLLLAQTEFARNYGFQQIVNVLAAFGATAVVRAAVRQVAADEFVARLAFTTLVCTAISLWAPAHLGVSDQLVERRLGFGLDIDPNGLGVVGAVCILSAVVLAQYVDDFSVRLVALVGGLFALYVMLMTGSRQALAIVVVGLTVWFVLSRVNRQQGGNRLILLGVVLAGAWVTTQFAVFDVTANRFEKVLSGQKSIDRLDHWRVALAIAMDHPLGAGAGGFISHFREYTQKLDIRTPYALMRPHNFFALLLGDWGVGAFAAVIAWLISLGRRLVVIGDSRSRTVGFIGLASAGVAMIASTSLSIFLLSLVAASSVHQNKA